MKTIVNTKFLSVLTWLFRVGLSAMLIIFLCIAPFTLLPNILQAQADINKKDEYVYQGILEVWHIETFEGGSASRLSFLEREAINFEKTHKGTYIVVQSMTAEQFELNIQAGKFPNMISFGIGLGDEFIDKLIQLDTENLRSDICSGGKFNSKSVALPYILGGYAVISNGNGLAGTGLKGANNSLKALEENNMQVAGLYDCNNLDSYDAYDKFIKKNFQTLIGTQRDVYRCHNRQQKGLMNDLTFSFLSKYTDLVQYISVCKSNVLEEKICKEFVSQLISFDVQNKLKDYNLFSPLNNIKLYGDGIYAEFENALQNNLKVENVFLSKEQIKSQKEQAYKNALKQ